MYTVCRFGRGHEVIWSIKFTRRSTMANGTGQSKTMDESWLGVSLNSKPCTVATTLLSFQICMKKILSCLPGRGWYSGIEHVINEAWVPRDCPDCLKIRRQVLSQSPHTSLTLTPGPWCAPSNDAGHRVRPHTLPPVSVKAVLPLTHRARGGGRYKRPSPGPGAPARGMSTTGYIRRVRA